MQQNQIIDETLVDIDQACIERFQESIASGILLEDCDALFAECLTIPSDTKWMNFPIAVNPTMIVSLLLAQKKNV